jgi:hypothetical protein
MDLRSFEAALPRNAGDDLPHLSGPAADVRQVLAAHFVRDCPHIVEIGGHRKPITGFLTHAPLSVLSVDPKTPDHRAETLGGRSCRVRHVGAKFQDVAFELEPGSYGLIMLGYSLKPLGARSALGEKLFGLIDRARIVVLDYAPALGRAADQVPSILSRPTLSILCQFDLELRDPAIAGSPYASRRFFVLKPGC